MHKKTDPVTAWHVLTMKTLQKWNRNQYYYSIYCTMSGTKL